jgi:hypothetical protein
MKPVEWERPRHIGFVFESRSGIMETYVEFDTIEAARDWRNEINGALLAIWLLFGKLIGGAPIIGAIFLYRRNRLAVLSPDPNEDANGIRINIPLQRVAASSKSHCFSFACMVTITIGADPFASNELVSLPTTESDASTDVNPIERVETFTGDVDVDQYTVRVSMIHKNSLWDDFMSHVDKAKARATTDPTEWPGAKVYVDYDPRADLGQGEPDNSGLSGLQLSVCRALGLDTTTEFFSK